MSWEAFKAPTNSNPTGPAFTSGFEQSSSDMIVPRLDNLDLAYETGVHFGDGSLWGRDSTYRYVISGSRENEQEYYRGVLSPLLTNLYGIRGSIYESGGSIFLCAYSKELVLFKHQSLGLPLGSKYALNDLPSYVHTSSDSWVGNFLSGFYDTDGSAKRRATPSGAYPRISLAQRTKGFIVDVRSLLQERFSITSTTYQNTYFDPRTGKGQQRFFLDVNGFENFRRFMKFIGTRSPHMISRIRRFGFTA